jgi:hypothetical protein
MIAKMTIATISQLAGPRRYVGSGGFLPGRLFARDLPFDFIIGAPARHIVNDAPIETAISTLLAIDTANRLARKASRHANRLKMYHSGIFSTHRDQRFLITCPGFHSVADHPALASSGLAINGATRPLRRYKRRWKIECLFAWLQDFWRLVVRWDRKLTIYQGFHLACLLITLSQF